MEDKKKQALELIKKVKEKADPEKITKAIKSNGNGADPESVSAGPVEQVISFAFNPSREKIREVTIIDRLQGRLLPAMDMVATGRKYIMEIAAYRQNRQLYQDVFEKEQPTPPDLLDEYMFRLAQWQKSVAGKNLERATDIALAEMESKIGEEEEPLRGGDAWKE